MRGTATRLLAALFLFGACAVTLNACNTVAGVGEDVSAVGKGINKGATNVKKKM